MIAAGPDRLPCSTSRDDAAIRCLPGSTHAQRRPAEGVRIHERIRIPGLTVCMVAVVRAAYPANPLPCWSDVPAHVVCDFLRDGKNFQYRADPDESGAFLDTPLASWTDLTLQARPVSERDRELDAFTRMQARPVRKIDKAHGHVPIVRAEEVVVRSITSSDRHGPAALGARQEPDVGPDGNALIVHCLLLGEENGPPAHCGNPFVPDGSCLSVDGRSRTWIALLHGRHARYTMGVRVRI